MFEIGKTYENRFGRFEVLAIRSGLIEVLYSTGNRDILTAEIQQRIIDNIESEKHVPVTNKEKEQPRKIRKAYNTWKYNPTSKYYRTIGYLAVKASIFAEVNHLKEDYFIRRYKDLKGKDPKYCVQQDCNRWGLKLDIRCIHPDFDYELDGLIWDGLEIRKNNFAWALLEMGFDLGHNHDIEKIRSEIPEEHLDSFDNGMAIGKLK